MTRTQACAILGVSTTADKNEGKVAYRRLVKQLHPEAGGRGKPDLARRFIVVSEAWSIFTGKTEEEIPESAYYASGEEGSSGGSSNRPPDEPAPGPDLGDQLEVVSMMIDRLPVPVDFLGPASIVRMDGEVLIQITLKKPWLRPMGMLRVTLRVPGSRDVAQYAVRARSASRRGSYGIEAIWFSPLDTQD